MIASQTSRSLRLAVAILAAGRGRRMCSDIPKPLHRLAGAPLLQHAQRAVAALLPMRTIVVAGRDGGVLAAAAREFDPSVAMIEQDPPRGTGDAARRAMTALAAAPDVLLVCYADTPLLRSRTLGALVAAVGDGAGVAVLGFAPPEPGAYGRLIESAEGLERIVEAADASEEERAVRLCNAGAMALDGRRAAEWLGSLDARNAQGEIYLTDVVAFARAEGRRCAVVRCSFEEAAGVNSRAELAAADAAFQARARAEAMEAGATLIGPESVFMSWDTRLGRDVTVGPNVVFGPGVVVEDCAEIRAFCHLEGCIVRRGAVIGPFARLRPGAVVGDSAHVGNFVEIKNAVLGDGAKANHLAYVGDATVGAGANIGAGAITCNYDGVSKHRTEIGAGAFIGSNSALVAPVRIGAGAYVASGSVVTRDVAPDALSIARARQQDKPGFAARLRARMRV